MRKQKAYIYHIYFEIATFLKTGVYIYIYIYIAVHFNKIPHTLDDFSFQCIDQVQASCNSDEIDRLLITKEAYWSAQLFSLAPHGLNKRKEFHSKNRTCYN